MRQSCSAVKRLSEQPRDSSGQRRRALYADLLPQNRAHREFETVPASRHPQSRLGGQSLRQRRIAAQRSRNVHPIGIEIEHRPDALDNRKQRLRIANLNASRQRAVRLIERNFKPPRAPIHPDRTPVAARLNHLDAGRRAQREKRQHSLPVIRRPETQLELILILRLRQLLPRDPPNLRRRSPIRPLNCCIESPHAAKSRRQRDLPHRQPRLVDQFFREVQTPRVGNGDGRRAQMPQKQPPQMPRSDAQPFRQHLHAAVFQTALADETQRPRDCVRCAQPRRRSRRALRPAAQARTKSRFRRRSRRRKVTAVLLLGRRRRTDRAAIHAAVRHADVKLAVEARIARQPRPLTYSPVQCHIPR